MSKIKYHRSPDVFSLNIFSNDCNISRWYLCSSFFGFFQRFVNHENVFFCFIFLLRDVFVYLYLSYLYISTKLFCNNEFQTRIEIFVVLGNFLLFLFVFYIKDYYFQIKKIWIFFCFLVFELTQSTLNIWYCYQLISNFKPCWCPYYLLSGTFW